MKQRKQDFPILSQMVHGKPLVYLDSASSSQKPECVIDAIANYYRNDHANVHRGVYSLSVRASQLYADARSTIQKTLNAANKNEIIFVRGATEGINLIAQTYGRSQLKSQDEILISMMEHHSNIVPWQMIAEQTGAKLVVIPVTDSGEIDLEVYRKLFTSRTKIVALTHASNVLGTVNPIKDMIRIAHEHNAIAVIDGAQAFPHLTVDVQDCDADFYVFSSHKAYGPTGIGVVYGKLALLEKMPPWQGGGDMIEQVHFEKSTYNAVPHRFEAGTPNISGVIGFKAALDYLNQIGMQHIIEHEKQLTQYATEQLSTVEGLRIIGTAKEKLGVISFVLDGIHPHDIGTILDHEGIAVRAGHHCAMPLMERFAVPATVRASFGLYNCTDDVDALIKGLIAVKRLFN